MQFPTSPFFNPFEMFIYISIIFGLIFIAVSVIFVYACISAQKKSAITPDATFVTTWHDPAVESGRTDRVVRLPAKCPSCGATISHEGIDWVGPLEARCIYCSATIHARLEQL